MKIRVALLCMMMLHSTFARAQTGNESLFRARALGQAYMEEEDYPNAIPPYRTALEESKSISDRYNLGLAYFYNDQSKEAQELLNEILAQDANNPFAHYVIGLIYKKDGDSEEALKHFQAALQADRQQPAVVYNTGLALVKLGRLKEAKPLFEETIQLDPKHSSSYYNLLQIAARLHDLERRKVYAQKFQELKRNEDQRPPDAVDECKYNLPIVYDIPPELQPNSSSDLQPTFVRSNKWQRIAQNLKDPSSHIVQIFENILDTHETYFVASGKEGTELLWIMPESSIKTTPLSKDPSIFAAPGDFNNDRILDLALVSPNGFSIYKRSGDSFEKLNEGTLQGSMCQWVDIDHDGDIDLIVPNRGGSNVFLQNLGNGTLEANDTIPYPFLKKNGVAAAASDLDNDNDIDLVHIDKDGTLEIFSNLRENRFDKVQTIALGTPLGSPLRIIPVDLDHDRKMELAIAGLKKDKLPVYRIGDDWSLTLHNTFSVDSNESSIANVFDINNDGYQDIILSNGDILYNRFPLAPQKAEKALPAVRRAVPVDFDRDGDLDIAITLSETGESAIFVNQGGEKNHAIRLSIKGEKNSPFGYNSKLEIKDGLFYTKQEVQSPVTYLGIGERREADVLRITWPNGVFQNIIHATAGQVLSVTEKPGYAGSCPFLYTWNGNQFEFIADFLSVGPLGLYVGGGQYFPPRADEYVRIRGDQLQPRDGKLELRLTEELREIIYLDKVELISVDHDPNITLFANERFSEPPFPEFKLVGQSKSAKPPKRAIDHRGNDGTDLISARDNRYFLPFRPSRFDDVGELNWIEIQIDDSVDVSNAYLLLTGYVDWSSSGTSLYLDQNPDMDFIMPYLQVVDRNGKWITVNEGIGIPAGKLKTVPVDIANIFPTDDHRIRIVTTVKVHWEEILVDPSPVIDRYDIHHHKRLASDLHYGGYSYGYDLAGAGPHWYDHSRRHSNVQWDFQTGRYTRYGDVDPLLESFDDKYVIMATGDEIAVSFEASPKPEGKTRTYFLHATGWVKDNDQNTAFSQTVEPLPFKAMTGYPYGADEHYPNTDEFVDYQLKYNTRLIRKQIERLAIPQWLQSPSKEFKG